MYCKILKGSVAIIDRRAHIGGKSYSSLVEETDLEYHRYSPHIFTYVAAEVWDYINQFGELTSYQHKVFITRKDKVSPDY